MQEHDFQLNGCMVVALFKEIYFYQTNKETFEPDAKFQLDASHSAKVV